MTRVSWFYCAAAFAIASGACTEATRAPAPLQVRQVASRETDRPVAAHVEPAVMDKPSAAARPSGDDDTTTKFQPPYSHRFDMFRRPDAGPGSPDTREVEPGMTRVALKGFINVDGLHALLEIDDMLTALKVGDERGGIKIVEITPPQVILQRGRLRWTERLYAVP